MVDSVQRRTYEDGDLVFAEGDVGDVAYLVEHGVLEVFSGDGEAATVYALLGPGEIVGEMALIDSKPRMASARASKGSTVIVVTRPMFEEKLKKADPFLRGLLNILVDNIRSISK